MLRLIGIIFGAGAAALVATALLGSRRLKQWETLTPHDAADGNFVSLADGARMHYLARGDANAGTPLILIHGMMDSAQNWKKNIDELARTQRVYAIDLIGFGYSARQTRAAYSLKYFSETVAEFLDALEIARANIVGHSLGGAVALELARRLPARVNKLVLINPAVYLINRLAALNYAARIPILPRALVGLALTSRRMRDYALRRALGDATNFDPAYAEWRRQPTRVRGTTDSLIAMAATWSPSDLARRLPEIAAPTLVLAGERDAVVPIAQSQRVARALPHAEFRVVPGTGHVAFEEAPAIIDRLILDFLSRA
ncbi:MAG: alpha/beta fold hydrolase [Chloroflexi bacterium]|nr:alpha/beta fold hydrolase [Chloroflexota bacterium]